MQTVSAAASGDSRAEWGSDSERISADSGNAHLWRVFTNQVDPKLSRRLADGPTFEITCIKRGETPNALKVFDPVTEFDGWIPLSQIHEMHFNMRGEGSVVMSEWIAKQKGFIK